MGSAKGLQRVVAATLAAGLVAACTSGADADDIDALADAICTQVATAADLDAANTAYHDARREAGLAGEERRAVTGEVIARCGQLFSNDSERRAQAIEEWHPHAWNPGPVEDWSLLAVARMDGAGTPVGPRWAQWIGCADPTPVSTTDGFFDCQLPVEGQPVPTRILDWFAAVDGDSEAEVVTAASLRLQIVLDGWCDQRDDEVIWVTQLAPGTHVVPLASHPDVNQAAAVQLRRLLDAVSDHHVERGQASDRLSLDHVDHRCR